MPTYSKFLFSIMSVFILSVNAFGAWEPVEWETPVKRFADLGLDPKLVASLAGEGQIVITLKAENIMLWTRKYKRPIEYKNVRIGYAASVVNAPVEKVRATVRDISKVMYMPLITESKILHKQDNHTMVQYTQVIDMPVIKLKQKFIFQHTEYENGDIAGLLHYGDVGAMVTHFEFFPLTDNKTLIVMAAWQDLETAGFAFRMFIKAEPAFKQVLVTMSTVSSVAQYRAAATEIPMASSTQCDVKSLPAKPAIPYLSTRKDLPLQALIKLSELGTVQFFHPRQILNFEGKVISMPQVTAVSRINYPTGKVKPVFSDLKSFKEFHPLFRGYESVEETGKDYSIFKMGFHIGPISLPVETPINEFWIGENIKSFYGTADGHLAPAVYGSEFINIPEDQSSFFVVTLGSQIGDKAPFYLKLLKGVPMSDLMIVGGFTLLTADYGTVWLNNKLAATGQESNLGQTD